MADTVISPKLNLCRRRPGPWPAGQGLPTSACPWPQRARRPAMAPPPSRPPSHVTVPSDIWCQTAGPLPVRGAPLEFSLPRSFLMSSTKLKYGSLRPGRSETRERAWGAISNVGFRLTCSQANGPEDRFPNCLDNHQNSNSETNFSKRDISEKQLTCIWWSRGPVSSFIMPDMSLAIRWLHCSPKYCPREFHWFSWTRLRQQRHLFTFF